MSFWNYSDNHFASAEKKVMYVIRYEKIEFRHTMWNWPLKCKSSFKNQIFNSWKKVYMMWSIPSLYRIFGFLHWRREILNEKSWIRILLYLSCISEGYNYRPNKMNLGTAFACNCCFILIRNSYKAVQMLYRNSYLCKYYHLNWKEVLALHAFRLSFKALGLI